MRTLLFSAIVILGLAACSNSGKMDSRSTDQNMASDSAYACPMHPEITSSSPGTCSICGMNLEKK